MREPNDPVKKSLAKTFGLFSSGNPDQSLPVTGGDARALKSMFEEHALSLGERMAAAEALAIAKAAAGIGPGPRF